jgi:acyl-[acyl-carrier-protein] desaturase
MPNIDVRGAALPMSSRAVGSHEDVIRAIEPAVERNLQLLRPPCAAWQPTDYLPDLSGENWPDELTSLRTRAAALPDDVLVVLVGDMVTEEALPGYSMALNQLVQDRTGTGAGPWARWLRGWTAEENRHGDLLSAYLRLGGRVDMRAVEETVQTLIANGFDSSSAGDPYNLLIYTSFQERATRVSHGNVGRLAEKAGDPTLARMCRMIAGDEAKHEAFYSRMTSQVLDMDPAGGIRAFAAMLERQIAMPGRLMGDGREPDLFDRFATVAQRTGVYTVHDYAGIIDHLVSGWDIAGRSVSGEAARAQDAICRAPVRYRRLADRRASQMAGRPRARFRWIRGRTT